MPEKFQLDKYLFFPLAIFLISVAAIALLGLAYYVDQKDSIKKEKQAELMAIAELKANEIEKWYLDQATDPNLELNNPFTVAAIGKLLSGDNSPELLRDVTDFLTSIKKIGDYYNVSLIDSKGHIRLSSTKPPQPLNDYEKKPLENVLATGKTFFSDLHMAGTSGPIHIDVFVPLFSREGHGNVPFGVIQLKIDPNRYLYPLIKTWPTSSPSAETLLVRREGDKVIFLNELRHRKGTALKLQFPLNQPGLPASMAAAGKTGVMEGTDYRGVKVVAAVRQIQGLPWAIVSKVDREELYAPIRRRLWMVSFVILSLTAAAGTAIGLFWYKQSTDYYKKQYAFEKKFEDVMSSLAEGIYVINEKGHLVFVNLEAERILGWTGKELSGSIIHDLIHSRDRNGEHLPLEDCPIHKVFETGERYFSQQEVFIRKDGSSFPVSVLASPVTEDGKIVASVVSFRDITAQKQMEDELLKAQKLESVGILAGGIAHDYNNLLQGIVGYIGLARSYSHNDKLQEMLEKAEKAANSAKELSFRLLTFSKGGTPLRTVVNVSRLVEETASMALCDLHMICEFDLPPNLHPIRGDEGQLYQVIRNISMNAKEAMPQGGKLTYNGRNFALGEESGLALDKGEYVVISIRDTGTGIAHEHLQKIFDPYFTTKEMGNVKGTGLGLSVCYSIVRNHGGLITVESVPGAGTTFHIYLPACPDCQL